jgi:hydroxymethylpyrimidine pyrophosphatase-like HAD family hydrolase
MTKRNNKVENTISFGDDLGDLEMIQKAGVGVAMANSVPAVLEKVNNVTLSVLEDGVAVYLEKHILGE